MSDPNFLTLQFANQLAQSQPLTQIGQGISAIMQDREARRQQLMAQKQYQDAMATFMKNRTPENRMAVLEAGNAIGRFDQVQQQIAQFDSDTRQQEVDDIVQIYGPLSSGNREQALAAIDRNIKAYERAQPTYPGAEGASAPVNPQLQALRRMREAIQNGNGEQVLGMLELELANLGEEGENFLNNWQTINQEERENLRTTADLIETTRKYSFANEEERQRVASIVGELGLPAPEAERIVELYSIASQMPQGAERDDFIADLDWRTSQAFRDHTQAWRESWESNDRLQNVYQRILDTGGRDTPGYAYDAEGNLILDDNGDPIQTLGVDDLALMNLYQRQIDNAVVRADDIAQIQSTVGLWTGSLERMREQVLSGQKLTPEQRERIATASEKMVETFYNSAYDNAYEPMVAYTDRFGGVQVGDKRHQSIFGDFLDKKPGGSDYEPEEEATPDAAILGEVRAEYVRTIDEHLETNTNLTDEQRQTLLEQRAAVNDMTLEQLEPFFSTEESRQWFNETVNMGQGGEEEEEEEANPFEGIDPIVPTAAIDVPFEVAPRFRTFLKTQFPPSQHPSIDDANFQILMNNNPQLWEQFYLENVAEEGEIEEGNF